MLEKTPFISAVIPVYNKGPHVARAIQSVLAQTFEDFELLLINDASTDNSLAEMQKFSDPRIRILHRDTPGPGGYAARNLGIREARAEWVAFLDADDEWYPEHLQKMHGLIHQFPYIKFFSCGWEIQDETTKSHDMYFSKSMTIGPHQIDCAQYLSLSLARVRPVCSDVVVISKHIPFAPFLFPEETEAKRGGDLHAWLKLICSLKAMAWSPHIGAIYHRDSVNMVTKSAPFSYLLMERAIFDELSTCLNKKEKHLLRKLFNRNLFNAWKENIMRYQPNFSLPQKLYWYGDMFFASKCIVFSIFPASLLRRAVKMKRWAKSSILNNP